MYFMSVDSDLHLTGSPFFFAEHKRERGSLGVWEFILRECSSSGVRMSGFRITQSKSRSGKIEKEKFRINPNV